MCGGLVCPILETWPAIQACALTRNLTINPLVHRPVLNPVSYTSQGKILFLFLEKGEDRERNISVWLLLMRPLLGTWPTTQVYALTGNWMDDHLVCRPALNPLSHTSQGCDWDLKVSVKGLRITVVNFWQNTIVLGLIIGWFIKDILGRILV